MREKTASIPMPEKLSQSFQDLPDQRHRTAVLVRERGGEGPYGGECGVGMMVYPIQLMFLDESQIRRGIGETERMDDGAVDTKIEI